MISFAKFPYSIIKIIILQPSIEFKIFDCLMFLLKNNNLDKILKSIMTTVANANENAMINDDE